MKSSQEMSPINSIKSEKKVIEKIKAELDHLFCESNNKVSNNENLLLYFQKLQELIKHSFGEVEDMEALNLHFEELRREKDGYKLQAKRLTEENAWLREELRTTQEKLQKKELDYIEVEENKKTLEFLLELQSNQNIENYQSKTAKISDSSNAIENRMNNPINMSASITNSTISLNNFASVIEQPSINGNLSRNNQATPYSLPVHEVPPRLKTLHQLVIQYATQGRYEIAIPLCKQTLQDLEQSSGHYHPDVATMLNILALVFRDKGDFEEAVTSLTEALEIRKKTLGPDSPKVAATLNNLSVLYAKQGNHVEAEPLCRDALKIRETILGPHHPDVAKQLNNLALLCHNQGKYDEVEKFYKRALTIYLSSYPSNDPNVIKTKNNLASSYIKQGKYRDAEYILKDVLNDAWERQWSGREKDIKSKPIWIIAEERERMKNLSLSMETLSPNLTTDKKFNSGNESNNRDQNGDLNYPPFGFDLKHKNKEDKLALLSSLKLLTSLYSRDNKPIASNIIDEWLIWASRPFSKYEKDIKWLSYEGSLLQSDIFSSSQSNKMQTLWYPSPSPSNSGIRRPHTTVSNFKRTSNTPFLYLDSCKDDVNMSSNVLNLSEYSNQTKSYVKQKLPVHLSPYLYRTSTISDQKSLSKYGVKNCFSRNMNLKKATSMTTLINIDK